MADIRSSPGDTENEVSSSSRLPPSSQAIHAHVGAEQKATIHKTIPGSRPRTEPPLDANSPDDLTRIRGIDRALADKLRRTGITHFEQIAEWSPTDVRSLSAALTLGRSIYKQNWIEQAARLTRLRSRSGTSASVSPAAQAADHPASNQTKSVASLIASAASAIRARLRMNQPDASASDLEKMPAASSFMPLAATPRLPPRAIDPQELAARIADRFLQIGAAAGITEAAFPEQETPQFANQDRVPDAGSAPEPPPGPARGSEPVPVIHPVQGEVASPAAKAVTPQLGPRIVEVSELATRISDRFHQIGAAVVISDAAFAVPKTSHVEIQESVPDAGSASETEPANAPAPAAETAPGLPDDLCLISDLSRDVCDRLNALGVHYFSEIAFFNADDIAALSIDCALGERINRECWVEQAAMLATGAVTRAASLRRRGEIYCLTPYPRHPLERDPDAFAALIPSPAVSLSDNAMLVIESEEPASPEPPSSMTARKMATLVETKTAATAPKQPHEPDPSPAVIETKSPAIVVADLHPATATQVALADAAIEQSAAHQPLQTPDVAAPEDSSDERHAEFPEYEEAEVTIKPRTPLQFTASPGISEPGTRLDPEPIDTAYSADTGSLSSDLSHSEDSNDGKPDEQAGYLRHVGEASVDIVPARPTVDPNRRPSRPTAPDGGTANTNTEPANVPKPVNRFLKALRGR